MPYTVSNMPDAAKKAIGDDDKRRRQWVAVFNSAYDKAISDGLSKDKAEGRAFAAANAAVKKEGVKFGDKANNGLEDAMGEAATWLGGLWAHFKGATKRENGMDFPAAAYAYVGDPEQPSTWKLRLWASPTEKENARQVGMAVAALGPAGFRGNKVDIPAAELGSVKARVKAAWRRVHKGDDTAKVPAHLAAEFSADGDAAALLLPDWANFADVPEDDPDAEYVLRMGPVMRTGDYTDRGLGLVTVDDLARNATEFTPGPMDLQHLSDKVPTILDGKLGALVALHHDVATDPDTLYGTVMVPRWLDGLQQTPEDRQVSTTWHIPTRTIEKMAWVVEPRVPGARLEEAYASFAATQADLAKRHDTHAGQRTMQRIHDVAAEAGAVCKRPATAAMQSAHERDAVQHIHDHAVEHGATCTGQTVKDGQTVMPWGMFSMAAPTVDVASSAQQEGAMPVPKTMGEAFARFGTWLQEEERRGGAAEPTQPTDPTPNPQPAPNPNPPQPTPATLAATPATPPAAEPPAALNEADQAVKDEYARMASENRKLRLQRVDAEAKAFAERYTANGAIFPAERAWLEKVYIQMSMDDETRSGIVAHLESGPAEGGVRSRLDLLKAWLDAAPPHQLTREMLAEPAQRFFTMANPSGTAFSQDSDRAPTKEEVDELMSKTPVGRAMLNTRDGVTRPTH